MNGMCSSILCLYRTNHFYALGLSLGAILDITNPVDYIKALSQIMNEFERHTSDDSKQKMVSTDPSKCLYMNAYVMN